VRRREHRQGVVKVNAGARLVMERASFFPWTAGPGAQKNFDPEHHFDPEHPLARDSKGRSLALALCFIV
jgi:hypothetical protein